MKYDKKDPCPIRHENGNCVLVGGFCTAVPDHICEVVRNAYDCGWTDCALKVRNMERRGRWIERLDGDGEFVHHMCSECKADAIFQYIIEDDWDEGMDGEWYSMGKITTGIEEHLTNCCPNCGAKMEQEAEK